MTALPALPVVSITQPDALGQIVAACEATGFLALTDHGIPEADFEAMRQLLVRLFSLDEQTKQDLAITRDNYRGFIPLGFFTPNRAEFNGTEADRYEGYKLHWDCPAEHPARGQSHLYGSNRWVDDVEGMEDIVTRYWHGCDALADRLLEMFAKPLGMDPAEFVQWHDAPLTNMSLLHYPPTPDAATGIHPHKDTNVITFLHPDPVGGLEVRLPDGSWIEASGPPDSLIVNVGEMLELWSGGRFVASPHRVVNRSGLDRYSFPYFVVPNHTVVVEPLLPPVQGFERATMPVGQLSAEVWRTNWPDEDPSDAGFDLGTLDR